MKAPARKKKACSEWQNKPYHTAVIADLEGQLQVELHVAGIERPGGLSEISEGQVIIRSAARCRQQEVGSVENVERLPLELHIYALGEFESLAQRHVGTKLAGTLELIAPQCTDAGEARSRQDWQT